MCTKEKKENNMGEKIRVPFNMTITAKSLGAVYDPVTGFYEMPDNIQDSDRKELVDSLIKKIKDIPESDSLRDRSQYSSSLIRNIQKMSDAQPEKSARIVPIILKKHDWSDILGDIKDWDTIKFLSYINEYGVPEDERQRIDMLRLLNTKVNGQYTLSYPALTEYSQAFNETYGWDVVGDITRASGITGANFEIAVYDARCTGVINEEQEALLRFVFPIAISDGIDTRDQVRIPKSEAEAVM